MRIKQHIPHLRHRTYEQTNFNPNFSLSLGIPSMKQWLSIYKSSPSPQHLLIGSEFPEGDLCFLVRSSMSNIKAQLHITIQSKWGDQLCYTYPFKATLETTEVKSFEYLLPIFANWSQSWPYYWKVKQLCCWHILILCNLYIKDTVSLLDLDFPFMMCRVRLSCVFREMWEVGTMKGETKQKLDCTDEK